MIMNFNTIDKMNKNYKIYKLLHPITKEIRYIGVTTNDYLQSRLSQHMFAALKQNVGTHVGNWIRLLNKDNLKPLIELIEICNEHTWIEREKYWISYYPNLTNIHIGGKGVVINRTIESKIRSANGHKKPIVQLDENFNFVKEWECSKDAINFYNLKSDSAISNALKGLCKYVLGYIWLYSKDYYSNNFSSAKREKHTKKVFKFNLKGELLCSYNSISEARRKNNILYSSNITEAVKRKSISNGFYWSHKDTFTDLSPTCRKIIRLSDNKIFNNFTEIKLEYNMTYLVGSSFHIQLKKKGFINWKNSFWEFKKCEDIV